MCVYVFQIWIDIFIYYYSHRDRAPFVLTPDMAYVINGGDTPTASFQKFTDLCCAAYNELRKNCNLFINLLELVSQYTDHINIMYAFIYSIVVWVDKL